MNDDLRTEESLKKELLKMDINLRRKQDFWEHPRNIAILATAVAAISAAVGGLAGYKFGSTPPQQIIIQVPAVK